MNKLIFLSILLVCAKLSSQEIKQINYKTNTAALFYKNSWKPFSGNILIHIDYKNQKCPSKYKYVNGFNVLTEIYHPKTKKLILSILSKTENGYEKEIYDSINSNTLFEKNEKFSDTIKLKEQFVSNYFIENENRTEIKRFTGIIKSNMVKTYFENGVKVKIEYFYDSDYSKIKECYEIFKTQIGNIDYYDDGAIITYNGNYTKWDSSGNIIEKGKYLNGKKLNKI